MSYNAFAVDYENHLMFTFPLRTMTLTVKTQSETDQQCPAVSFKNNYSSEVITYFVHCPFCLDLSSKDLKKENTAPLN